MLNANSSSNALKYDSNNMDAYTFHCLQGPFASRKRVSSCPRIDKTSIAVSQDRRFAADPQCSRRHAAAHPAHPPHCRSVR